MTQLPLLEFTRLRIAHRYLLKARVEITSYNLHKASPDPGVSRPQTSRLSPGSLKPFSLSNQCSPERTPGFPVEFPGVGDLHAAFLDESRTRILWWCLVQEIRDH